MPGLEQGHSCVHGPLRTLSALRGELCTSAPLHHSVCLARVPWQSAQQLALDAGIHGPACVSRMLPYSSAQRRAKAPISDPQLQTVSELEGIWGIPIHQFSGGKLRPGKGKRLAQGTPQESRWAQIRAQVSGKGTLAVGRRETGSSSLALNCFTSKMG